jgi:hypothetical protein
MFRLNLVALARESASDPASFAIVGWKPPAAAGACPCAILAKYGR